LRVVLDHSVPRGLRTALGDVEVRHAFEMGWHELRNGDLLRAAEGQGFDVLITSDKNIRHQNRLAGMRIAILELSTNHWHTLQRNAVSVSAALVDLRAGEYRPVTFPRPRLIRRPPPSRAEPS
jgi:hypothetical protein